MSNLTHEAFQAELRGNGFHNTTWDELGVTYDEPLAANLQSSAPSGIVELPLGDNSLRPPLVLSKPCLAMAHQLLAPLVERLFDGSNYATARRDWFVFAVNYYKTGDVFGWHRDRVNSDTVTTVIATVCGQRTMAIEKNQRLEMTPANVVILDGSHNLRHMVWCTEGPSMSVVADVPELLY